MKNTRLMAAIVGYMLLMLAAWFFVRHQASAFAGVPFARAFAAFALLFAPLWFCGFGVAGPLTRASKVTSIMSAGVSAVPYFVFAFGTPEFYWHAAIISIALPLLLAAFIVLPDLPAKKMTWRDAGVLAIIIAAYFLKWTDFWPGLPVLSKLFLADIALYCFFAGRRLEGMGYSLIPTERAFRIGFREWLFYFPIALALGAATGFIHFHAVIPHLSGVVTGILVTSLLIALPEELFFRAIVQNLLETRIGRNAALVLAAILFGLSHFNHGSHFNWRYVLLASIAGIFYGRAWRAERQVLAALVTHTAVDVAWSLWFR
jgi:membrane protease YdiL (CAAX protease family)